MNILVIVELYFHKNKSGGECYLHYFLKKILEYTNAKINVLIPQSEEDKKFEYEGIYINETIESVNEIEGYIKKADLVITQLMLSKKIINLSLENDKKIIWILHGYFDGFRKLIDNNRIIKVFNSKNVLVDFQNSAKGYIDNYFIIYPFCDFTNLSKYKNVDLKRREYITFVNPVENKGSELILKLAKNNKDKKFLIVEGGYGKIEQETYLKEFRKLSNTHIIKNTKDIINEIYLKSKIVIMASKYESYGLVAQESACFGIPCIINKNTKGLVENMGILSLGGKDWNHSSYQNVLDSLDIPENYHIWSNYYFDVANERFEEIQYQYKTFLESVFIKVDDLVSEKTELHD